MSNALPAHLCLWVTEQAEKMGLPGPDSYILLLLRLEKQRQDVAAVASPSPRTL